MLVCQQPGSWAQTASAQAYNHPTPRPQWALVGGGRGRAGGQWGHNYCSCSGRPSFFPHNVAGPGGVEGRAPAYYSYADFWKHFAVPVGFRQLLVSRFVLIIVHSVRGHLTFDPLPLCPLESLLGQTAGKWQGCVTSKINVGKYVSDASSFTGRLPNSHRGKKGGEGEGRPDGGEDIVIQTKRAAERSHLGRQLASGSGAVHAPPVQNCPATCKCFSLGKKKNVCLTQKARKCTVWRGLKELSCPDALHAHTFVNETLAWHNEREAEWGEIIVTESVSAMRGTYAEIL